MQFGLKVCMYVRMYAHTHVHQYFLFILSLLEQLVQILKLSGATICSSSVRSGAIVLCDPSYLNEEADLSMCMAMPYVRTSGC